MNKARRARLERALTTIGKAADMIREARSTIAGVRDDESEALDNLGSGQRDGELGDDMQAAVSGMDEALDMIDALDASAIGKLLEQTCEVAVDVEAEVALTAAEVDERRRRRLPAWATDEISRLATRAEDAERKMASMFDEATGAPGEMVVDDSQSPLDGRRLPFRSVDVPSLGLRMQAKADGLSITGERRISILPVVSNSIVVKGEKWS